MSESFYRQVSEPFAGLELFAAQTVEGFITGLHKSPFHGFSVEFAEHRGYNPGESIRHIDWKLYGRTDRLYVKKFQEETNLRCHILIDNSSSMYYPVGSAGLPTRAGGSSQNKLSFSICAAACLSTLLIRQRDAVGLNFFSSRDNFSTEVKSNPVHLKYLMTELEKRLMEAETDPKQHLSNPVNLPERLHMAAEQIHKRSLIILFSDMFTYNAPEPLFDALQHLRYHNNEVILFHVTHREKEENLEFPGRHYCFTDMETGKEIKLSPSEYREIYRQRYGGYKKELENRCSQYRIDFVEADIQRGFVPVLQSYLVKRERIY